MVNHLTDENAKIRTDMRTLCEEHTEVLNQLHSYRQKNQELMSEKDINTNDGRIR